ncbi:MAG: hypothetical protein WCI26_04365 [Acidimicrobiales bacterium]
MNIKHSGRHHGTLRRMLLAAGLGLGLLITTAGTSVSSASGAASQTSGTVVFTGQAQILAPPAANFSGSAGGDGWGLAFTKTAVYNVFHHSTTLVVACHDQSDASQCWDPETIQDGSGNDFATSGQPGLWIDQASGHLFVYASRTVDSTGGVVCIDTTQAATNPNPFCGFTALSAVGDAPLNQSGWGGISDPVVVANSWYAFNYVAAMPTGTQDQLLCFSLTTLSACASQPFAIDMGTGGTVANNDPSPPIAAFGSQIVLPLNLGANRELACFDATTSASCAGTWPIDTTADTYPDASNGAPFPMLDSIGVPTGFCAPTTNDPCWSLTGSSVPTPLGMTAAMLPNNPWDGPAVTLGARTYAIDGNSDAIDCWDYIASASCSGYPMALVNSNYTYTINRDPQRPTCLWTNADGGTAQIQSFDAYTGGPCGQGPVRVPSSSIVASYEACIPSDYQSLTVTLPDRSSYVSGTIQFQDINGNQLAGVADMPLDANGSVNLSGLHLSTINPLPQFLVNLDGAGTPPEIDIQLVWSGTYSPLCTSGGQTTQAPAPTDQGYRLGAADGGVFAFGHSQFYGSMTGKHLNGPEVGIASTPDGAGYWLAASDGGVFAFGDAQFHGSKAESPLAAPIVEMAATPDGGGYWLVGADGGVFSFGDASFYGSVGAGHLTASVVGMAASPSGHGYWLVGSDGNVYPFGDAGAFGSEHGKVLGGRVVAMATTPDGGGYWLAASDGGVFAFGDAPFLGSMTGKGLGGDMVGIMSSPSGHGYWTNATDGGVFAFGDAQFLGCMVGTTLFGPMDSLGS